MDTKKVSQIGVYAGNRVLENTRNSNEGVYRVLTELHHLFDFIDFDTDPAQYELIILPDTVLLPEDAAWKLKQYIKNGGKVLLTGKSGLNEKEDTFALHEFGVDYHGMSSFVPRYMHITGENFPGILPMDYVAYEQGISVKALPGAQVLAYTAEPYFNRTYDRFCSHRQTPPEGVTSEPCIVRYGNLIHISNPLFRDYSLNGCMVYRDIIKKCIRDLLQAPLIETDLPATAELTLRKQGTNLILHILHYIPQRKCKALDIIDEIIPLYEKRIKVRTCRKPERVYLAPQQKEIDFAYDGGIVEFVVPSIEGRQMVAIEF